MYKKIFLLFILICFAYEVSANVSTGTVIKASKFNNSMFTIGDIKTSILTLSEFQSLHGNCWIKLNQATEDINIAGSDLANLKNITTIKSSHGRFLRAEGTSSASLGQQQEDDFKSHTHIQNAHNHVSGFARASGYNYSGTSLYGTITSGTGAVAAEAGGSYTRLFANTSSVTATNQTSGGTETRPKNLTVNMFIKINHECD